MSLPVVAVVGRPNVGKSTLFNRILGSREAVVAEESGVTRDQHIRIGEWGDRNFLLVDTGGIIPFGVGDQFHESVSAVARDAIAHADAIILVVDVRSGITDQDLAVARELRGQENPVVLAVNKAEARRDESDVHDFHRLGLGEPHPVSALHGEGIGDLLDAILQDLPEKGRMPDEEDLRVALVGRPNVGKSSLLNSLVGRDRALVSDIAGTTRDAIDTVLKWHGKSIRLVDTAGIRRKSNHEKGVEYFSSLRTLEAIQRCDVAVLLLDATDGVTMQDARIAGEIHETGRGCLIAWNKWDAIEKDDKTYRTFEQDARDDLRFLSYAPVVTISATERTRIGRILEHCDEILQERKKQVETSRLNDILQKALARNPPGYERGGRPKVFYATQTGSAPPRFTVFVNRPELFPRNYLRYLNNQIRAAIGFKGTRIYLDLRKRT
jgi:GTP-binding protein